MTSDSRFTDIETLQAVIARSPIVVARSWARPATRWRLPAGYEAADVAVLDWIAGEGRRVARRLVRI